MRTLGPIVEGISDNILKSQEGFGPFRSTPSNIKGNVITTKLKSKVDKNTSKVNVLQSLLDKEVEVDKIPKFLGFGGSKYNSLDKWVTIVLTKTGKISLSDRPKKCEVLTCRLRNSDALIIPQIQCTKNVNLPSEDDLFEYLFNWGCDVYSYMYDVEIEGSNFYFNTQDKSDFLYFCTDDDWSGETKKTFSKAGVEDLVWIDIVKLTMDEKYAKDFKFGNLTLSLMKFLLRFIDI